jgi:DNA-binding transcriptional regulator PaaX
VHARSALFDLYGDHLRAREDRAPVAALVRLLSSLDIAAPAVRSVLVHEWRKFLFTDPGLPAELLPADWVGHEAARFFASEAGRLLPAASRFVDSCLDEADTSTEKSGAHQ